MKNQLRSLLFTLVTLAYCITASSQSLPKKILNCSDDSLIHTIEYSKRLINSNLINISQEEIASCGLSCYQRGSLKHAREFFIITKDRYIEAGDSLEAGKMLSNIAVTHELEGNYDLAVETHHKALAIFQASGDYNSISRAKNNLGVVFQEMGDTRKALEYYNSALKIKKTLKDKSGIASSLNNIGVLWEENFMSPDSALFYYLQAYELYKELRDNGKQAKLLSNISAIYVHQKRFDEALQMLEEGKQKAIEVKDMIILSNIMRNSAFAYMQSGNISKAEEYINKGLQISIDTDYLKNRIEFLSLKAEIQETKSEYKNCIQTQKDLQLLKDSLLNTEKNEAISKQEVLFDTKQKEHKIEIAEQALMFSQYELERQKGIMILSIIGAFLISMIVLLLVIRAKQRHKLQKVRLENKMLRSQMNPHFMFNALGAIQNFTLEHSSDESMIYLIDFSRLMRNILDSSRSEEIKLDKEIQILQDYLDLQRLRFDNAFSYKINVDSELNTDEISLPPMLLQPFIENSIEHGMKRTDNNGIITLNIKQKKDFISLQIEDNGPGFNQTEEKNKKHISHALNITKERIKAINHLKKFKIDLDINKNSETGVIITFEIFIKR